MKTLVSRFEANLVRITQGILTQTPADKLLPLLGRQRRPSCLSRDAVELVMDALRKGVPLYLARAGGWRCQRFLRAGQAADGRLWERSRPEDLSLAFTAQSMEFLLWLTAAKSNDDKPAPEYASATLGDQLLYVLSFDKLRQTEAASVCLKWPGWQGNALFQLFFPEAQVSETSVDWQPWLGGAGAGILEALQDRLSQRWLDGERMKADISQAQLMQSLGRVQETILDSFLRAVHAADRCDLARFLLETARTLLEDAPSAQRWTAKIEVGHLRLSDRLEVYRAALAFIHMLERLAQWEQEARTIGYFDGGYAAAQLWKADWEHYGGPEWSGRAAALAREVAQTPSE